MEQKWGEKTLSQWAYTSLYSRTPSKEGLELREVHVKLVVTRI